MFYYKILISRLKYGKNLVIILPFPKINNTLQEQYHELGDQIEQKIKTPQLPSENNGYEFLEGGNV